MLVAAGPLVTVSCPSLSAELLESELFGHVRGAFTGVVRDVAGKVASAEGGTLFLDEVGDLPPPLQPKLLRFLQEKKYERVGETKTRAADVRLVGATNRDLEEEIRRGSFRSDLYYRLNVITLHLPPLRDRADDVPILVDYFLQRFSNSRRRAPVRLAEETLETLQSYDWPGNVRELENALERAVVLTPEGEEVRPGTLPTRITERAVAPLRTD